MPFFFKNSRILMRIMLFTICSFLLLFSACHSQALAQLPLKPVTDLHIKKNGYNYSDLRMKHPFTMGGFSPKASTNPKGQPGGWISDLARDGFTLVGPWYPHGKNWLTDWLKDEVSDSMKYNIGMIYPVVPRRTIEHETSPKYHGPPGTPIGVSKVNQHGDDEVADADNQQMTLWLTDIETQVRSALANPAKNRVIALWYMMPEEMRSWKPRELELLRRMYETIKKVDPENRPAMMYQPQHSSARRLAATLPYQDILSVGIYPHHSRNTHNRIQVRHAMTQMMEAIEKSGSNALPVPILEMFESTQRPFSVSDAQLIPSFVRHDVYCAIANGAKGFLVWSMGRRKGFSNYSTYYKAWADVSKELHDFGIKDVITKGDILQQPTVRVIAGQQNIRLTLGEKDDIYPSISIRAWSFEGKEYIMLVNSAQTPVTLSIGGLKKDIYKNLFGNGSVFLKNSAEVLLSPLDAMMLANDK